MTLSIPLTGEVFSEMPRSRLRGHLAELGEQILQDAEVDGLPPGTSLRRTSKPSDMERWMEKTAVAFMDELTRRSGSAPAGLTSRGPDLNGKRPRDVPRMLEELFAPLGRLRNSELADEQEDHVRELEEAVTSFVELVGDIDQLSRIVTGSTERQEEPVDVSPLVEQCVSEFQERASRKGIDLRWSVSSEVPASIITDSKRLQLMLGHLITNAISSTEEGHVTVDVDMKNMDQGERVLSWNIRDTGTGIKENEKDRIFDPFYSTVSDGQPDGIGLGLTVVRQVVNFMEGRLYVESKPGEGTCVQVDLPLATKDTEAGKTDPARATEPENPRMDGKKVLVADDDPDTRRRLKEVLEGWNASVTMVTQYPPPGEEGSSGILFEQSGTFDVLFLNPHISGLEGFDLLERVSRNRSMDRVVSIASSPYEKKNRHYAATYGIQYFLSKPVQEQDIREVLISMLEGVKADQNIDETTDEKTSDPLQTLETPINVLLAEDNQLNREFLTRLLASHPVNVTSVTDGGEAVEAYRDGDFDIVFMDVRMPEMDGIEATAAIREFENKRSRNRTPVVALTAETSEEKRQQIMDAGCDNHVAKPVDVNRILGTIRDQLQS